MILWEGKKNLNFLQINTESGILYSSKSVTIVTSYTLNFSRSNQFTADIGCTHNGICTVFKLVTPQVLCV